jgi:hypothetical protein
LNTSLLVAAVVAVANEVAAVVAAVTDQPPMCLSMSVIIRS